MPITGFSPASPNWRRRVFADRHIDARTKPGGDGRSLNATASRPTSRPMPRWNFTGEGAAISPPWPHEFRPCRTRDDGRAAQRLRFLSTLNPAGLAEAASVVRERILSDVPSRPPETNRAVKQGLLVNRWMTFTPQSRRQAMASWPSRLDVAHDAGGPEAARRPTATTARQ